MRKAFGFELNELSSWSRFVKLMNRPEDPSSLALFRVLFGLLMMADIPNERGMHEADYEYGTLNRCKFPLFDWLQPLPIQWMLIVYGVMFLGALGITIGFKYRIACLCFTIPYWYIFLLDKTTWNNHSYLYGLIAIQLTLSDANRYLSVDALLDKSICNSHVPLWNYCLLRTQVFLVYFIAGLKKIDYDWIFGYSMTDLATHWVFDPFKYVLSNEQITLFIVHGGGLFIDLTAGFLLFFDSTRWFGALMTSSFHLMNSCMFSIGMFPYAMLATTTIFYSNDWPRLAFARLTQAKPYTSNNQSAVRSSILSPHCIYDKVNTESENKSSSQTTINVKQHRIYHKVFSLFVVAFIGLQCFLPYSHFVTKGYNNWTNGLYGYSWDMMVHSWHTQHVKIYFVDKTTNQTNYLNPRAWTTRRRWSSHADMVHQYARCIEQRLAELNYTSIELYMDVWRSMNHRFNQRQLDPRVNLLEAEWSAFKTTPWIMPLLSDLSGWRVKMQQIEAEYREKKLDVDLTFVADVNGLFLENFVSAALTASVEVLNGQVNVEIEEISQQSADHANKETSSVIIKRNITLNSGQRTELPSNTYHKVYTISEEPSCYFYTYVNKTTVLLSDLYEKFSTNMVARFRRSLTELQDRQSSASISSVEDLMLLAYNRTLVESSKNFLYLLAASVDDKDNTTVQVEMNRIHSIFKEKKLSQKRVYRSFIEQFYVKFMEKEIEMAKPVISKYYNLHFLPHLMRFKQSFAMLFFAFKSVAYQLDFKELIANELFNYSSLPSLKR